MSKYLGTGTRYLCAAVIASEGAGVLPTYGAGFILSKMSKIVDTPNNVNVEAYYDDELEDSVFEVKSRTLAIDAMEPDDTSIEAVYGATVDDDTVEYGSEDNIPFVGVAYYRRLRSSGVYSYQGVYYPKAKAVPSAQTHTGKGANMILEGVTISMTAYACETGKNKYTKVFDTEAAAKAWVDSKLGVATFYEIKISVSGTGTVSPVGTRFVASAGSIQISIDGSPTKVYDNGADVTASVAAGKYTLSNVSAAHNIAVIYTV